MRSRVFAFLLCFLLVLPLLAVVPVVGQGLGSNYEIEGDHVWVDDAYVNLEVWPHTTSGGWVYLNFTSKQFGGVVDVVFGFDRETHRPKKFQVYSPHTVTEFFDEAIPSYYYMPANASEWAYQVETSEGKVSGRNILARKVFYKGTVIFYHKNNVTQNWDIQRRVEFNILDNRVGVWHLYWQIDTLVEWAAAKGRLDFEHKVFRFAGMSDWFMLTVDVVKGKSYHARFWLDILPQIDGEYGEYWVAVKRHSDSILEAVQNRRFYALDPWWDSDWDYKVKLTVDHTLIDSDLTWFPVAVFFDAGNMNWSNVQDDLDDFRFMTGNETVLLCAELEDYTVNTDSVIHVSKAGWVLDSDVDTDFYCYFGNPTASSAWDAEGVWNDDYVMVQHMVDATTSTIHDSTANNNDGTKKAANEPIETASGQIDSAQDFDGTDDLVTISDSSSLGILTGSKITISAWVRPHSFSGFRPIVSKGGYDGNYWYTLSTAKHRLYVTGTSIGNSASDIVADVWTHIAVTFDEAAYCFYTNGVLDGSGAKAKTFPAASAWAVYFAYKSIGADGYYDGDIDETRISKNIVRPAAWVKAEYWSGLDGLLTYGSEEEALPPTIGEFSCPAIVYPSKSTFWNVTARYDVGRTSIKNVTLELEGGVELLWIESTKVFSETADPNGYFTLGTGTYVEENATSYIVCFQGTFASSYPEGYKDGDAEVWGDDDVSGSGSEVDWFLFSAPPVSNSILAAAALLLIGLPVLLVVLARRKR